MPRVRLLTVWNSILAGALVVAATACGDDGGGTAIDAAAIDSPAIDAAAIDAGVVPVLKGPSKSSTIALSDDGALVVMVNPETDTVTVFKTSDNSVSATVTTGDEPAAVIIGPDSKTAYVANRAAATVVKITRLDTATPTVSAPVNVGSEPTGLALSPTGAKLFVAEYAESRVSTITTATMTAGAVTIPSRNPRSIAVTNNLDASDDDETLIVAEFFGVVVAGKEAQDDSRTGLVKLYKASDLASAGSISFAPRDSTFGLNNTAGATMTSPNQLWAVAVQGGRIFVPSISASPAPPANFAQNVFPVIYVGNLTSKTEDTTAAGTINLARKVVDAIPAPSAAAPRYVMGDTVDLSFVPGTNISYAVARGAEAVTRIVWDPAGAMIGSTQNQQFDLNVMVGAGPCQQPTGIVVASPTRAYVNCWATKRLGVIDLGAQQLLTTVKATDPLASETAAQIRGRHFYFTGRGRWSKGTVNGAKGGEGWSSCGSCHPDGLTDNITWSFGTGPRQTVSQDGSFSHGAPPQKQRVFNFTGIFDEHADFERNVRGVSGGVGAITKGMTNNTTDCTSLATELPVQLTTDGMVPNGPPPTNVIGGLAKPFRELANDPAFPAANPNTNLCIRTDWDDVDEFVKTIRPPRAIRFPDPTANVANGRTAFTDLGCVKCHSGAGWTISRRFWTPAAATNTALTTTALMKPFAPAGPWATTWNFQTNQIQSQPIIVADATGPAEAAVIAPPMVGCTLRNVGTFGIPGDAPATTSLEKKDDGSRSEGRGGYNVPSLYGLAVGAPYLHHGQAVTLTDLFTSARWANHTQAGAANPPSAQQVKDLIAFVLSIDAATVEIRPIPTGGTGNLSNDACPVAFP